MVLGAHCGTIDDPNNRRDFPKAGQDSRKNLAIWGPQLRRVQTQRDRPSGPRQGPEKDPPIGAKGDRRAVEFYSGNGLGSIEPAKGSGNLESP